MIAEARDDVVAAFHAAGIPLKKLQHPSMIGLFKKMGKNAGCYPKDDKSWKVLFCCFFLCHIPYSQESNHRVYDRHFKVIQNLVKDQEVAISFDETTDSRGKSVVNIVVMGSKSKPLLIDVIFLECFGPNDGAEHKEVAVAVNESLTKAGILPSRVKFVIVDEGSVMVAAYKHRLSELHPNSQLHICVAHKLHGTGSSMTKSYFDDVDVLLAAPALLKAGKHASTRRRWFRFLQVEKAGASLPPKVGATRWCSWRDACEWWCQYLSLMKKFIASEVERNPWIAKKEGQAAPLLHRINEILSTRFSASAARLAFIADHTQGLSKALNAFQSFPIKLALAAQACFNRNRTIRARGCFGCP